MARTTLFAPVRIGAITLNRYDRSTFYSFKARGYTNYPTYEAIDADEVEVA